MTVRVDLQPDWIHTHIFDFDSWLKAVGFMMCLFNVQNSPNFPGDPSIVASWKAGNWLNWPGENGLSEIF